MEVSYAYDSLGRFASVSSGTNVYAYSYLPGSDLVSGMTSDTGHAWERIYEPDRDLIETVHNRYGNRTISRFDYTNDEIGRRVARVDSGEAFAETAFERYAYNARSEVIGSQRFYGADIDDLSRPVTGRTFGYGYDPIAISRSLATRRRKAARPPDSVPEPPLGRKKWPADEFLTKSGLTTPSIHRGEMLLYLRCRRNTRTEVRSLGDNYLNDSLTNHRKNERTEETNTTDPGPSAEGDRFEVPPLRERRRRRVPGPPPRREPGQRRLPELAAPLPELPRQVHQWHSQAGGRLPSQDETCV